MSAASATCYTTSNLLPPRKKGQANPNTVAVATVKPNTGRAVGPKIFWNECEKLKKTWQKSLRCLEALKRISNLGPIYSMMSMSQGLSGQTKQLRNNPRHAGRPSALLGWLSRTQLRRCCELAVIFSPLSTEEQTTQAKSCTELCIDFDCLLEKNRWDTSGNRNR